MVAVSTPLSHTTVLLDEAVEALLAHRTSGGSPRYVDATFGRGGHTRCLLARLPATATVIAFDKDPEAIAEARRLGDERLEVRHAGFAQMADLPEASVQGVLMDLGVSSPQIDDPARGFSFRADGPLDMRMDPTRGESVAQWLARADVRQIAEVIRDYGEERFALSIAKAIDARRQSGQPLVRTAELAQLVAGAVKIREAGQEPATRTFQALRIFINAELEELQQALNASLRVLAPGGRLAVISFHSLEDRIVKKFIARESRETVDRRQPGWMLPSGHQPRLIALGRIRPGIDEIAANPRSRSAVMRVAERTAAPAP